ncbi:hypothetical protein P154DRAFT_429775 [Amniculicola lignicola CBS 123094]|uniref:Rhodopsin domain-containing protein n=1 Tax=Amniculicola lignicola CBS 123094 TaxID=1392246 RepID=A0A6A5WVB4_9PLEO|nr:hypothetical protein P154DRAFT_429775 [Amniculicola lignicola CBS 123094]
MTNPYLAHIPPERLEALRKEDQRPLIIGVAISFTVLAFISVVLRCFTRIKLSRNCGYEDGLIALSMAFSAGMAACQIMQAKYGAGIHSIFFTGLPQLMNYVKYIYFSVLAYRTSLCLTRVSILLQYRRIFTLREMRIPIYIIMGICIGYGIASVSVDAFGCRPIDAFWDFRKRPTAKCIDHVPVYYANAGINVLCDLLVAALPVKSIWSLPLPIKQKAVVLGILTLGWFVCVVSILRLHSLVVLTDHPEDASWYSVASVYWMSVETNLAIVCASVPALKPLVISLGGGRYRNNSGIREPGASLPLRSHNSPGMMDVGARDHSPGVAVDHIAELPKARRKSAPLDDEYHNELREQVWRTWDKQLNTEHTSESQKDLVSVNEAHHPAHH